MAVPRIQKLVAQVWLLQDRQMALRKAPGFSFPACFAQIILQQLLEFSFDSAGFSKAAGALEAWP